MGRGSHANPPGRPPFGPGASGFQSSHQYPHGQSAGDMSAIGMGGASAVGMSGAPMIAMANALTDAQLNQRESGKKFNSFIKIFCGFKLS